MFTPITLESLFSDNDRNLLKNYINNPKFGYRRYDDHCKRELITDPVLETYFSKKLEPIAKEVFNDQTLATSATMYAKYNQSDSMLPEHRDRGACTYTIDYCLDANIDWPITIDGVEYSIGEGDGLAFMGVDSVHGRHPIKNLKDVSVEMVFFHFVPSNHWYFNHCKNFELD